ncbi:MAG: hypothetical protein U0892_19490 [Pirellulales bacterium]
MADDSKQPNEKQSDFDSPPIRESADSALAGESHDTQESPKWKKLPKPDFRIASAVRNSAVLAGVIVGCGAVVAIATFRHADRFDGLSIAFACAWCLGACVIPIWFKPLLRNGGTYQLAVITWRLLALLPAMAWGMAQTGASRNSFMTTLMAVIS